MLNLVRQTNSKFALLSILCAVLYRIPKCCHLFLLICLSGPQSKKKSKTEAKPVDEGPKYGPTDKREGEHVFAVAHIFASFNDTFVVSKC